MKPSNRNGVDFATEAEGDGILDSCYAAGSQGRIEIADSDAGVEFSGECTWKLE